MLMKQQNSAIACCLYKAKLEGQTMHRSSQDESDTGKTTLLRATVNNIFPKLTHAKYLTLMDVSSKYYYLKLKGRPSCLTFHVNLADTETIIYQWH